MAGSGGNYAWSLHGITRWMNVMKTLSSDKENGVQAMGGFDKLLVSLDLSPWGALYRIAVGFAILPAMSQFWGENRSPWALAPFLLIVLILLRVIPAVVRKLVPFSGAVQVAWAERRQLAKRWDSYQWKKLFWIGLGLGLNILLSGHFLAPLVVVAMVCVVSGALGLARWRIVSLMDEIHVKTVSELA